MKVNGYGGVRSECSIGIQEACLRSDSKANTSKRPELLDKVPALRRSQAMFLRSKAKPKQLWRFEVRMLLPMRNLSIDLQVQEASKHSHLR